MFRAASLSIVLCAFTVPAIAEPPSVVASIKPIHSLAAAVMEGVGEPALLLDANVSPHAYALRPSDAASLSEADMVVWVGPGIEAFLPSALDTLATGATILEAGAVEGLTLLPYREGGLFEPHPHGDQHAHDHDHDHAHDHGDEETDAHVWLDPDNAKAIVSAIEAQLVEADPQNASAYEENTRATRGRIDVLKAEIEETLRPVAGRPFLVFHDAYQYFENAFGLEATGSVMINPEVSPGARRVAELQARIEETGTRCLISEPQFPREIVDLLSTPQTRTAELDPNGFALPAGPGQYEEMMRENARALAECLGD